MCLHGKAELSNVSNTMTEQMPEPEAEGSYLPAEAPFSPGVGERRSLRGRDFLLTMKLLFRTPIAIAVLIP